MYESNYGGRKVIHYSCADTAKLIRQALKEKFAGVKFSVRSDVYSMGASIRIKYDDENVAQRDVEAVAGFFNGASFDGMIDLKSYHNREFNGEEVHFGADYVFVDNEAKWRVNRDDAEAWEKVIGKY
jgi:hypothetical protein